MIEKLNIDPIQSVATNHCIINKINELIDAVNVLQCKNVHIESDLQDLMYPKEITGEILADPYVAQRKWVGKLCWYKLCEGDTWKVGRLEKIQENADAGYPFVFDGLCYKICEPVKPDDDIIYKGGDNE